jgi:hypothetical protein
MWSGGTSLPLLIKNHSQLLEDLSGSQKKKYSDTFWQELLTFSAPLTKFSPTELEAAVLPFCEKIGELSVDWPLDKRPPLFVEYHLLSATRSCCKELSLSPKYAVQNNACTSNFQTLLEHSLQRIQVALLLQSTRHFLSHTCARSLKLK